MPKRKRRFEVLVEAKLTVDAFDEGSAQRKAERSLGKGRRLDSDVASTGHVWSYDAVALADPAPTDVTPSRTG